ncbi:phage integrase N-terminal SAM-like domain-containing protein [Pseudoalteromonas piscicida]|uniref:phage integrase N-terminal SAM-like domain-containing protein n=1 Tax=Pseudoalteromonas piscicida TaxID=43662 RepID=UPI001EFED309|nr:phage integrase N-terminal SAM-like domain-containing protein [Pseudoalteromonas piscicida]
MRTRSSFLNHIAEFMLTKQYSLRTVDTYLKWISSQIHFHDKRNPASMGDNEVVEYLNYLNVMCRLKTSASVKCIIFSV